MDTIKINVSAMFADREPYDCSGSQMELGSDAGRITWRNARHVAECYESWLLSPLDDACEAMRGWAESTGAWDREEVASWTAIDCLALLVQNVASELRLCLDADDLPLIDNSPEARAGEDCADVADLYEATPWEHAAETPMGCYYREGNELHCDWYAGS